jgi:hypothetical protein
MAGLDFNTAPPQSTGEREPASDGRVEALRTALRNAAPGLVRDLFPLARFQGNEARIGSADGEAGESMSIVLTGEKAGQWFDHNPMALIREGDLITLWAMGHRRKFMEAVEDLELHLGLRAGAKWTGRVAQAINRASATPRPKAEDQVKTLEARYVYTDDLGNRLGEVLRYRLPNGKKTFSQRGPGGEGKAPPDPKPLYNQQALVDESVVVLVEGEKCVEALREAGITATTAMGGASFDPARVDWKPLRNRKVLLWPDNDDAGRAFMARVQAHLHGLGIEAVIVRIPANKPEKWDAANASGDEAKAILSAALSNLDQPTVERGKRAMRFLDLDDLADLQPPDWMVEGLVPVGSFGVVVGPPGSYKSFLALDWAICMAAGIPWQGKDVADGLVVYVAGEGHHGLAARILGALDHKGLQRALVNGRLKVVDRAVAMPTGEADELLALIDTLPEPPKLIVLDTLARTFGPGDENSQRDMNAYVAACDKLREVTGATVLVVHHTGKDIERGARGSTALTGAADVVIGVKRSGNRLTVINTAPVGKQKDAEEHADINLLGEVHRFDRGRGQETTIVLMPDETVVGDQPEEEEEKAGRPSPRRDKLLHLLTEAAERGMDGISQASLAMSMGTDGTGVRQAAAILLKQGLIETWKSEDGRVWYRAV